MEGRKRRGENGRKSREEEEEGERRGRRGEGRAAARPHLFFVSPFFCLTDAHIWRLCVTGKSVNFDRGCCCGEHATHFLQQPVTELQAGLKSGDRFIVST